MKKFIIIFLCLSGLYLTVPAFGEETNHVQNGATITNATQKYSDAELQAAAQQVWHKLIVFGVLALVGGAVVSGFACYGAYRKFGVKGVVVVCAIVAFGVIVLGGLLLLF